MAGLKPQLRCAIYTRKSSEEGLDQDFNSLDAQREACEAYIKSQCHEGWVGLPDRYDDGGYSGGNTDRPALARLITAIKAKAIDIIVVYKIDRLSRSLSDFVKLVDLFDQFNISFVSVTQQFNTSTSMGRLTLNVLLSFAQFEREVTGERIRDKIAASVKKGIWTGGPLPLGYNARDKKLIINPDEAKVVRHIFDRYIVLKNVRELKAELDREGYVSKVRMTKNGPTGGNAFQRGALYTLLKNPIYIGKLKHRDKIYDGEHPAVLDPAVWHQAQETLQANRQANKYRLSAKQPSLLAGLVYDDQGNPMSPSHGNKDKNKRYRYYVSQATLKYKDREAGSVTRTSAHQLEELVTSALLSLLEEDSRLIECLDFTNAPADQQAALIHAGKHVRTRWQGFNEHEKAETLKKLISKVTVGRHQVTLSFQRDGLFEFLGKGRFASNIGAETFTIALDVSFQRCGIETKLIVGGKNQAMAHIRTVKAIQGALHNALKWNHGLVTGKYQSTREIADESGISQRYVAEMLKLAGLSPKIVKSVFSGRVPATLSLVKLKRGFPREWSEQVSALGFDALFS